MTYLVILTTYAASRATDIQQIRDQDGFVAVGSTSSRPEHHSAAQQIAALGWDVDSETSRLRQLVRIRLPKEVDFSPYKFAGLTFYGLHTPDASSHDGNGSTVFASVGKPASIREAGSDEAAFSAALASGIYLSVPQPDGSRCRVKCPVVGSSPIYSDHCPDDFKAEFDAQTAREFDTTIC